MHRRTVRWWLPLLLVAAAVAAITAGLAAKRADAGGGEVRLAMIGALTGSLSNVGIDNRRGMEAALKEIKATVNGRKLVIDVFDDTSNPSQSVQLMQRIAADSRYIGVIGSGFSSSSLANAPLAEQFKIPYISMAGSGRQVYPAKPYVYTTTATSRLFAYSMARYLRSKKISRIALIADTGGYGAEGTANVQQLAKAYGLEIVVQEDFPLTATSFTSQLTKVRGSNAQAIWIYNATPASVAITKEARQLGLQQLIVLTGGNASATYLEPACPQSNGAVITSHVGLVAKYLPKANPSKAVALRAGRLAGGNVSTFVFDGYTGVHMFRQAMIRGGFSREGINTALETKLRGFVGPAGTYNYTKVNHAGLSLRNMAISQIKNCQMVPVPGQNLTGKK